MGDDVSEQQRIDVSTRKHRAHRAAQTQLFRGQGEQRGDCRGPGGLHHQLGPFQAQQQPARERLLTDRGHIVDQGGHMLERHRARLTHRDAVGHGLHGFQCHRVPGFQRHRPGGRTGGLHGDDPHLRTLRLDHRGDTGDEAAAARWHHDGAHFRQLLQDLQPDGGLPGHDVVVVERVNEHRAGFCRELRRRHQCLIDGGTGQVHGGSVGAGGHDLGQCGPHRHEHRRRDAQRGRGPGHTLRVVTRAGCHHTVDPLLLGQPADPVVRAARFERSCALQVFALQPHLVPAPVAQRTKGHHRCAPYHRGQPLGHLLDLADRY
ncbi:Uncharacterised protein [Mycobacteroides abscessus subsp. abscessus]|nr:Uncharacterised protein [Mycobacteroides abscessus subsp. abscessus]